MGSLTDKLVPKSTWTSFYTYLRSDDTKWYFMLYALSNTIFIPLSLVLIFTGHWLNTIVLATLAYLIIAPISWYIRFKQVRDEEIREMESRRWSEEIGGLERGWI